MIFFLKEAPYARHGTQRAIVPFRQKILPYIIYSVNLNILYPKKSTLFYLSSKVLQYSSCVRNEIVELSLFGKV